jgi:hypothetical protein
MMTEAIEVARIDEPPPPLRVFRVQGHLSRHAGGAVEAIEVVEAALLDEGLVADVSCVDRQGPDCIVVARNIRPIKT